MNLYSKHQHCTYLILRLYIILDTDLKTYTRTFKYTFYYFNSIVLNIHTRGITKMSLKILILCLVF